MYSWRIIRGLEIYLLNYSISIEMQMMQYAAQVR